MDRPFAVAVGEMFDGVEFFGPFDNADDAQDWADREVGMSSGWWLIQLNEPRERL